MIDAAVRRLIDPPLDVAGARLARIGITADMVTVTGFGIGLGAVAMVAQAHYGWALGLLLANRICDGLDGAVARRTRLTEFGGYLDIVCDFLIWALLPVAFALADPAAALASAVLLASFMGSSTTFLAYAILAARHGETTQSQGRRTFHYLEGLTEGTETIVFFALALAMPHLYPVLAYIFAAMAAVTTVTRLMAAVRSYRR